MRKLLVLVVPVLAVAAALAASGSAFAAGGDAPRRDGGRGVWFTRVCATPGAALGACGAQVVTNSGGTPLAGGAPAPTALGPGQFHSAYGLPTTAPTPQTIAIVDAYDDPNIEIRPRDVLELLRVAALHDGQRLLPQGEPGRRNVATR